MIQKIHEFERNGKVNEVYRITNNNGCEMDILTYGARIIRLTAPDKNGYFGLICICKKLQEFFNFIRFFTNKAFISLYIVDKL